MSRDEIGQGSEKAETIQRPDFDRGTIPCERRLTSPLRLTYCRNIGMFVPSVPLGMSALSACSFQI